MRTLLRFLLIPVGAMWLFGGCAETLEPKPLTYTQLLTGTTEKSWRLVSYQIFDDGNSSQVIPVQGQFDPCVTDDLYTFYANEGRRYAVSEGASKCGANDPDIFLDDQWTLVNASATLEFAFPILSGQRLPYTIKNLTGNVLTIEIYLQNIQDINASYRFTFNAVTTR
ncbi:hypothetical protein GGR92_003536 [Spirosoma lacussanchae]|uniref:hypothetical protein n=1 Tax=Spirosoma lacussanchae TaxID=1884249 RepID=UPI0011087A01|nr:hypothetical protein [Spirosoma lacussanchae]